MTSVVECYKQAIDLLTNKELNYRAIVIEFAKHHPKLFMKLVVPNRDVIEVLRKEDWMNGCRKYLVDGKKVEAIKLCRNATGLGLKEAKDVCDRAQVLTDPYAQHSSGYGNNELSDSFEEMAQAIAA